MIKPESHVVQQIRRDKFRAEHMNDFPNTWDHHQHQNIRIPNNLDLIGILQNQIISVPVQTDLYQDSTTTFMNMPQSIHRDPQGSGSWRSSDLSQPSSLNCSEVNYGYDQAGIRPSNVGDLFSNHFSSRNHCPLDNIAQSSMTSRSEVSCLKDCVPFLGQNNLQNVVTVACSGTGNEASKSSYDRGSPSGSYRGELLFLPSLEKQSVPHNASQWNHEPSCKKPVNISASSHTNKRGFSLSLSSEVTPFRNGGNATVSSTMNIHGDLGPLGPFTGYASILKSSRYLEPAQKMLEEFCISYALKEISGLESTSMDDDDLSEMLTSTNHAVDGFSSSSEQIEPKNRLKRAKLLFLEEEVCKGYKLYNHQLQTVVSSFDSVAGLNTAAPFISLALKRIFRSFKALKAAISEQLKQISSQYSSGDDNNIFQKQQRSLIGNIFGFESPQQHIWRPQRGLPERAVAVLRAWLFDHFLHPYPTDSDKQMLATQTSLSRNQVSNWFINARVRLWKPMVEEIHMLETKVIKNTDSTYNMEPSNGPNTCSSPSRKQTLMDLPGTKRPRLDYVCDMNMMEFNTGLGNVSLTLGLRRGVDNVIQTQTQDPQFGTGGQMFHDFVG
ncbi:PREDICTED: BEL1-like homeodomain protein 8 [Camelina sativa]|uniref:BEL1-like homeodomain protein 8 n=1 Tax=Camelina sativa TaxID=90675 RepID=A0ABM0Z5I0_CAMSA|nr:PREDICTED: BEL1-like homeodomain protein 8 [Camelina sativa]